MPNTPHPPSKAEVKVPRSGNRRLPAQPVSATLRMGLADRPKNSCKLSWPAGIARTQKIPIVRLVVSYRASPHDMCTALSMLHKQERRVTGLIHGPNTG